MQADLNLRYVHMSECTFSYNATPRWGAFCPVYSLIALLIDISCCPFYSLIDVFCGIVSILLGKRELCLSWFVYSCSVYLLILRHPHC